MDESGLKIHKLGTNRDHIVPVETPADDPDSRAEEQESTTQTAEQPIRYVTIPHYDPGFIADEETIDLLALWSVVRKYRKVLFSVVLLALLLSTAIAVFTPPTYRAELIMAPVIEEKAGGLSALAGQFGGLASLAGVNVSRGGRSIDRVLATLQSRAFLVPIIKEEKMLNALLAQLPKDDTTVLDVYHYFTGELLEVRKDTKTALVTLSIEWNDPEVAAVWANKLVAGLNEHQRKYAIHEAEKSIEYLESQLQQTAVVDMQQAIYRLIESQTKAIMLANVKKEYVMHIIDPAVAPQQVVHPKVSLIIILGLIAGLMLGIFLIFMLHAVENLKLRAKLTD